LQYVVGLPEVEAGAKWFGSYVPVPGIKIGLCKLPGRKQVLLLDTKLPGTLAQPALATGKSGVGKRDEYGH
jgi:hypothetical protein